MINKINSKIDKGKYRYEIKGEIRQKREKGEEERREKDNGEKEERK